MIDLVEDAQGVGPRPAGGDDVSRAVMNVAERAERIGLVEPVTECPAEVQRTLITVEGPSAVAQSLVNVAETVPGSGLPGKRTGATEFPDLGQRAFAAGDGLPIVTELGVGVANVVERPRFEQPVACRPVQLESSLGVPQRFGRAFGTLRHPLEPHLG